MEAKETAKKKNLSAYGDIYGGMGLGVVSMG